MLIFDFIFVLKWWAVFLILGLVFLPLTSVIFNNFKDKGYIFSKIIALIFITYSVFIISFLHLLKFSFYQVIIVIIFYFFINFWIIKKTKLNLLNLLRKTFRIFFVEEVIFLITLSFWAYIRGNNPDINGLEKFMDFGFINSILRSDYFPPKDMWYTPLSINYYYFGHLVTSVLIKLSNISSSIGYNLMVATIFAFTFTCALSIGINIFDNIKNSLKSSLSGFLSATLITLGGNLTTIYALFKPYQNEHPVPFTELVLSLLTFPNNFWYPNATRFIPFTIHEFPLYSFVVSDLHGHVLDIPFVLITIALILSMFLSQNIKKTTILLISFLLAVLYMTNAWDGLIYMLLALITVLVINLYKNTIKFSLSTLREFIFPVLILIGGFFVFLIPFNLNFKPFVSGIGIICAPKFLTDMGNIGPFLFEAGHCQRSPLWQISILYGFFYFFVISFLLFLKFKKNYSFSVNDKLILIIIGVSSLLILVPEFIYIKDIYPMHYRANTMFKLAYESFIMLSISCGYIAVKIISVTKNKKMLAFFFIPSVILITFVISYPVFAINSYYNDLKQYKGLDGTRYLKTLHSSDYQIINWFNNNVTSQPVVLEAVGDSYTDYSRISANTGLPTVLGWPVHEWLWRGSYDIAAPRIEDVKQIYENANLDLTKKLIKKYKIIYIVISKLEKEKYPNLNEDKFKTLGNLIYIYGDSRIYKINY